MPAARPSLCATVALALLVAACGDGSKAEPGPYDELAVDETIAGGELGAPVDVVRDRYGVPHIWARSVDDLAYAVGYVMASDRIQQMDLFRHFASGTVAELFGALDQDQIDSDIEMRMHRMRPLAEEAWAELQASDDPLDQESVRFLQRFADGVNAFIDDLRAGDKELDPSVEVWFDPARAAPWTPVDSLTIGRLQAWNLSFVDREVFETDVMQRATAGFDDSADPDRQRRAGIFFDAIRFEPMDPTPTIDGWPAGGGARAADTAPRRPRVPAELLAGVMRTLRPKQIGGAVLRDPRNGSNNWVVGPDLAGGATLMANDPHLTLASPSIFYALHMTVPGELDVAGITFPGIPGVILGHNQHVAWGATTANHDVTDYYLEEIAPCTAGGGDCVTFEGGEVALETWTEEILIGANGTITDSMTVTYERVPHHGPIVPVIEDHDIAPRGSQALSVKYTGHLVTHELRAFQTMWRASSVDEGLAAFESFGFGAQNFVITDDAGNIGWTTHALVPWRPASCYTFDAETNPEGVAPFYVLPGDGGCEWEGFMEPEYIPQAVNPAAGFLATANGDPVGAIADGDPLNLPVDPEGRPIYIGARDYAEGWRAGRITRRLEALAGGGAMTAGDMTAIQADTHSNYGSAMTPHIVDAVAAFEEEVATPGTHPDLEAWVAGLDAGERAAISAAGARLAAWDFRTPAAVAADAPAADVASSSATVIFNAWAVLFLDHAFDDEGAVLGFTGTRWANTAHALFERTDTLVTGLAPETGEPILCDDMSTAGEIESCTLQVLRALDGAIAWASGSLGFGTADMDAWRWGDLHRLTLETLFPAEELEVPPPNDPDPALRDGYPRPGDQYSVDASSPGLGSLAFRYDHGPAMRHVTTLRPGEEPRTLLALPGGQTFDRASPHFRDLMDQYWSVNEYFELAWTTDQVIGVAETRTVFE